MKDNFMKFKGCLRDLNLTEIMRDIDILNLEESEVRDIRNMIEQDSNLLIKHNLMDYSLLMVIEKLPPSYEMPEIGSITNCNRYFIASNRSVIHLGIIDYLQEFNFNKNVEMRYKKMQVKDYKQEVASVPAEIYGKRF